MADNDGCFKRVVGRIPHSDFGLVYAYADHHEWRFLRQDVVVKTRPTPDGVYDTYYCVFCLKLDRRLLDNGTPTQYR